MDKSDICVLKSVSCTRSGSAPNIKEKCHLSCQNAKRDITVIVKDGDTKAVQPGQMFTVSVKEPSWEAIVPED